MKLTTFEERKVNLKEINDYLYEIPVYTGIASGEEVPDGFGDVLNAPAAAGIYDLWEIVDSATNNHLFWKFCKGQEG